VCFKCTYEIPTQHWENPPSFPLLVCNRWWAACCCGNLLDRFKTTHFFRFSSLLVCFQYLVVHYNPKVMQSLRMLVDRKLFNRNFFSSHFESQGHCKLQTLSLSLIWQFLASENLSFSLGIVALLVQFSFSQPVHHFRHEPHKAYIIGPSLKQTLWKIVAESWRHVTFQQH
jgi:hypothetical protein